MRRRRTPAAGRGDPVGVILAGGAGQRIGGSKAIVNLGGRPLISYPLEAMWRALGNVAVVAKIDTELPNLPGVTLWIEPAEPRHPLAGLVHALGVADGRPVMVCPVDLPFVTPEAIRLIAGADPGRSAAVIARAANRLQPLLGCYQPEALGQLTPAMEHPDSPVIETVNAMRPTICELEDSDVLFNINYPDDLLQASAMLDRRREISRQPSG